MRKVCDLELELRIAAGKQTISQTGRDCSPLEIKSLSNAEVTASTSAGERPLEISKTGPTPIQKAPFKRESNAPAP